MKLTNIKLIVFDWDGTLAGRNGRVVEVHALKQLFKRLRGLGCDLSIMSYNIHGVGFTGESVIYSELAETKLGEFFSPKRIFGYLRAINTDEELHDKRNVHPVFITREGLCDITCKVRAIGRYALAQGLSPSEVLFIDNAPAQTAVAHQTLGCHAFTVIDRPDVNSCITREDMQAIYNFVRTEQRRDSLWFSNSAGETFRKPLKALDVPLECQELGTDQDPNFGG